VTLRLFEKMAVIRKFELKGEEGIRERMEESA
jgi:hypothetical protein